MQTVLAFLITLIRWLLHPVALVLAVVLLDMVCLRETPAFWTNAGGHPVWLRTLVLKRYHPLLFAYGGLIVFQTLLFLNRPVRFDWLPNVEIAIFTLLWLAGIAVLTIMSANNIDNLLHGRALHAHPAARPARPSSR